MIPHPSVASKIKNRWLRRTVVCALLPYALGLTISETVRSVFQGVAILWRADYIPPQG